jgi:predicted RNA binding protein YcfA (HicA-like mRNA interferase family)
MGANRRRIERILSLPPEADFSDIRAILLYFGWQERQGKGSYVAFRSPDGAKRLTIPIHGRRVKRIYVQQLCQVLDLYSVDLDTID